MLFPPPPPSCQVVTSIGATSANQDPVRVNGVRSGGDVMVKVKGAIDRKLLGYEANKMAANIRRFQPSIMFLHRITALTNTHVVSGLGDKRTTPK